MAVVLLAVLMLLWAVTWYLPVMKEVQDRRQEQKRVQEMQQRLEEQNRRDVQQWMDLQRQKETGIPIVVPSPPCLRRGSKHGSGPLKYS